MAGHTEGFDLFPPLANNEEDKAKWACFLASLKQHYVFWADDQAKPKADHIAFAIGDGLKLPKDGMKFRSFASFCPRETRWDMIPTIATVWKTACHKFGFDRTRFFSSFMRPDGFLHKEGDQRSTYETRKVAQHLEGVE